MHPNELLNLTLVLIAGLVAPMIHYGIRRTKVPAVVLEIVIGMIIGPDVLGGSRPMTPSRSSPPSG